MGYNLRKNPTSSHKKDYIYDCRKTTIVKLKNLSEVYENDEQEELDDCDPKDIIRRNMLIKSMWKHLV